MDIKTLGVLTTPVTTKMDKFKLLQKRRDPELKQDYISMPNLARLIEDLYTAIVGNDVSKVGLLKSDIKQELKLVSESQYDYLVLGCTHYSLINKFIEDITKSKTICPCLAVVEQTIRVLSEEKKEKETSNITGERNTGFLFLSTKDNLGFIKMNFSWLDYLKKSNFLK